MRMLGMLAAVFVGSMASVAVAAGTCVKPGVPVCMGDGATFVSADKMIACQGEVKDYIDSTMAYLKCQPDDVVVTGEQLKRNVDRFNCHLSGGGGTCG